MTLEFLTNGQINYNNGTTNYKVQTAGATTFTATTGTSINVSGLIDYSTQRYSIFFNGVEQIGGSSIGGGLSFRNVNATGQSAVLLLRGYARSASRLLLWSGLCFVGLAINNGTEAGHAHQPQVEAAIMTVLRACVAKKKHCGIGTFNETETQKYLKAGFTFIFPFYKRGA